MSAVQIETSRSANRLCLDCTSLARAALSCPALNLLKTNYKTITEIASLKMTMPHVVEGAREQGRPSALVLCLSVCGSAVLHSFSPTLLLSQLVPAEAIDIITVLATEERKGVDR